MDLQKPGLRCSGSSCYWVFRRWLRGCDRSAGGLGLLSVGSRGGCGRLGVAWGTRCGRLGGKRPRASGCFFLGRCSGVGRCLAVVRRVFAARVFGAARALWSLMGTPAGAKSLAGRWTWQGRRSLAGRWTWWAEAGQMSRAGFLHKRSVSTFRQVFSTGPYGPGPPLPGPRAQAFVQLSCHRVAFPPSPGHSPRQRPRP